VITKSLTIFAGTSGGAGTFDATGSAARFYNPGGIATDSAGNIYVTQSDFTIRKITPQAVVTTLAGSPGAFGLVDGTGAAARFRVPVGVVADAAGNVYVADYNALRKITPAGVVTTLAGGGGFGYQDGPGAAATFETLLAITIDGSGNLYVIDSDYTRVSNAGTRINHHFCPNCGVTVCWARATGSMRFGIPVGTFNDPSFPAPSISVWEDRRYAWPPEVAGVKHWDTQPPPP
jgi:hypothetical protein